MHIIKNMKKFKNLDDLFQPENHFIKKSNRWTRYVAFKRGDAEICLVHMNGNHVTLSLKGALHIPSNLQDIFSVKFTTENWATITFFKCAGTQEWYQI